MFNTTCGNQRVNSLAKSDYSLTFKALAPSTLESQKVKLALQIFNEHIIQGLNEMSARENLLHSEKTANFIQIISTWWEIVNVWRPFTIFITLHSLMILVM